MLISIINKNAEQALLSQIELINQQNMAWGMLYIPNTRIQQRPSEEDLLNAVKPVFEDRKSAIYLLSDGDVAFAWQGVQKSVLEALCNRLSSCFNISVKDLLDMYNDPLVHGEKLRFICKQKMPKAIKDSVKPEKVKASSPTWLSNILDQKQGITSEQIERFQTIAFSRRHRYRPEILIVEDQAFSSKMLAGVFEKDIISYVADSAEEALNLYIGSAPDITLLDIELPGMSGHDLASILNRLDEHAFIIMVTGNNYIEDVTRAIDNGAKGYIVKPFSKQKVLDGLAKFMHERKARNNKI